MCLGTSLQVFIIIKTRAATAKRTPIIIQTVRRQIYLHVIICSHKLCASCTHNIQIICTARRQKLILYSNSWLPQPIDRSKRSPKRSNDALRLTLHSSPSSTVNHRSTCLPPSEFSFFSRSGFDIYTDRLMVMTMVVYR